MSLPLHDVKRRRDAKRANEQLKLTSTFMNNLGVATMAGAVIVPLVTAAKFHPLWILASLGLHVVALLNLRRILSED